MSNLRYLICGGAGYIGSHVTELVRSSGGHVEVLDNFSTGHPGSVKKVRSHHIDINDTQRLTDFFLTNNFDLVIHLCAKSIVSDSIANPLDYYLSN
jgi:UDP-glucose 4-epimerase